MSVSKVRLRPATGLLLHVAASISDAVAEAADLIGLMDAKCKRYSGIPAPALYTRPCSIGRMHELKVIAGAPTAGHSHEIIGRLVVPR